MNTYTDGTPLTGTGKLRITSNSGTASSNGVRISKVEIYFTKVGYYYNDYCTNVVTLSSIAISGTPTKKEYTEGEEFNPSGLTVTGTYSDGNNKEISTGIIWTSNPNPLTEGTTSVTVTAKVGSISSAEYVVTGLTVSAASGVIGRVSNLKDLTDGVYIIVGQQKESSFGKLVYGNIDKNGRLVYTSSYTSSPSEINSDFDNEKWRLTVANDGKVNLYSIGGNTYLTSSSGKFRYVSEQSSATSYTVSCNENGVFSFANGTYYLSVNNSSDYWRDYAGTTAYSSGACLYLYRLSD